MGCAVNPNRLFVRLGAGIRRQEHRAGFTLIELVVVISLLSFVLVFSLPSFEGILGADQQKKFARWLMIKTRTLKEKALRERKLYRLHIGPDTGRFWITTPEMDEAALEQARDSGYRLPDEILVLDVEYPENTLSTGEAVIRFYPAGYSDKALIHVEDGQSRQYSFFIEPFLPQVRMVPEYASFQDAYR